MANKGKTWSRGRNSRPGWSFHMEKFPARLLRSRLEKPRSCWLSQPTPSYERTKNFTKDIEVRPDLGNRASPVNRAHMKRPTLSFSTSKVIMSTFCASMQPQRSWPFMGRKVPNQQKIAKHPSGRAGFHRKLYTHKWVFYYIHQRGVSSVSSTDQLIRNE